MVYSQGARPIDSQAKGHEFKPREFALEAGDQTLVRKGGLSGCRKGLKTVPLAQALLSPRPAQNNENNTKCLTIPNMKGYIAISV